MDRVEIARCRRSWKLALLVMGRQEWKQGSEGRNRPVDSAIIAAQGVWERREIKRVEYQQILEVSYHQNCSDSGELTPGLDPLSRAKSGKNVLGNIFC